MAHSTQETKLTLPAYYKGYNKRLQMKRYKGQGPEEFCGVRITLPVPLNFNNLKALGDPVIQGFYRGTITQKPLIKSLAICG